MKVLRIAVLASLLAGAVWLKFVSIYPVSAHFNELVDFADNRPAKRVLFIGNSRSFYNDMPDMIRTVADADSTPYKLQIVEHLLPGESLKEHWANERLHALFEAEHWDEIVIQAESGAHYDSERDDFHKYGTKLAEKAGANARTVRLLVTWPYDEPIFDAARRSLYQKRIQSDHRRLAARSAATMTDVGAIWEANRGKAFDFRLTSDGNHPTIQGSYIVALALYTDMKSDDVVAGVGTAPEGITPEQARVIQERVAFHWQMQGDL